MLKNLNSNIRGRYYLRISDANDEIVHALRGVAEDVLSSGSITAIVTREIQLPELNKLITDFKIDRSRYFLAGILD